MNQWVEGAFVGAAGMRNYLLYVATSRAGESPPLFVMLHGCDQDAADFAVGTRMNDLAEECRGVVLYPQQCRWVNPFGGWNWHDASHQSANHGDQDTIVHPSNGTAVHIQARRVRRRASRSPRSGRRSAHIRRGSGRANGRIVTRDAS